MPDDNPNPNPETNPNPKPNSDLYTNADCCQTPQMGKQRPQFCCNVIYYLFIFSFSSKQRPQFCSKVPSIALLYGPFYSLSTIQMACVATHTLYKQGKHNDLSETMDSLP